MRMTRWNDTKLRREASRVSDSFRIPVQQVKRLKHMPAADRSKTKCLYQRTDTGISMERWPIDANYLRRPSFSISER